MKAVGNRKTYLVFVVVVLALATVVAIAMAQPAPAQGEGGEDGQQRRDRGDRGARMMGGMMGMLGGSAMSVTDDAVFVLTGGMLLKYDVETLELLAQAEIPRREFRPRGDRDAGAE